MDEDWWDDGGADGVDTIKDMKRRGELPDHLELMWSLASSSRCPDAANGWECHILPT